MDKQYQRTRKSKGPILPTSYLVLISPRAMTSPPSRPFAHRMGGSGRRPCGNRKWVGDGPGGRRLLLVCPARKTVWLDESKRALGVGEPRLIQFSSVAWVPNTIGGARLPTSRDSCLLPLRELRAAWLARDRCAFRGASVAFRGILVYAYMHKLLTFSSLSTVLGNMQRNVHAGCLDSVTNR